MLRLAVLGDPVAHSLSPRMHRAALAELGIEGSYEPIRVDAAGMGTMIARLHHGVLDGANITMPHKRLACRIADEVSPLAARTGAVNTFYVDDQRVVGDNTDVGGFRDAADWAGLPPQDPVLILGSGGAAAAALVAFEGRGVHLAARRPEAARALAARLQVDAVEVMWGESVPGATVVNCTSVGMQGEALPPGILEAAGAFFETVYATGPTPAQRTSEHAGLPTVGGLELLVAQGARSFGLWTGVSAPIEVMRAAITT